MGFWLDKCPTILKHSLFHNALVMPCSEDCLNTDTSSSVYLMVSQESVKLWYQVIFQSYLNACITYRHNSSTQNLHFLFCFISLLVNKSSEDSSSANDENPILPIKRSSTTSCLKFHIWGVLQCLVTQSCPTLCDPMDCSPPGSSVHGILQARILQWVALPSSRGSSQPRDQIQISHTAGGFFTI